MIGRTGVQGENKRPGSGIHGGEIGENNSKRQRCDGTSTSTSGFRTGTNDDLDDFLSSNLGELDRIEDQYSQRIVTMREEVREVPDFARRSLAPLRQAPLNGERRGHSENAVSAERDGYIRIEEVRKPLERYHEERRRNLREKKRLEDKLREKDEEIAKLKEREQDLCGEIKVVRSRVDDLTKEKANLLKEQMESDQLHRNEIAGLKKTYKGIEEKLKSDLTFAKKEVEELKERLRAEKRHSGSLQSQPVLTHPSNNHHPLSQHVGTPVGNRTSRPSSNGPAFPSRSSFYGGGPTPHSGHRPRALAREAEAAMEIEFTAPMINRDEAPAEPLDEVVMPNLVIPVENGVKSGDNDGAMVTTPMTTPVPPPVAPELKLTDRLREKKLERLALEHNEPLRQLMALKLNDMIKNRAPLSVC